jgi:hypothetical protein
MPQQRSRRAGSFERFLGAEMTDRGVLTVGSRRFGPKSSMHMTRRIAMHVFEGTRFHIPLLPSRVR